MVGMALIVVWKKAYSYGSEEPLQPSQQTKNLMYFLLKNCMTGPDANTELCSKIMKVYHSYCQYDTMCLGFFNSNGDNDD